MSLRATLAGIGACALTISVVLQFRSLAQTTRAVPTLRDIASPCPMPTYSPPPGPPDTIAALMNRPNRYRLVIAPDVFSDRSQPTLDFVRPTAQFVDRRLGELGYNRVPSLSSGAAYLTGAQATKARIREEIRKLALATQNGGMAIIYWIGHGNRVPPHNASNTPDVALAVYDEPVSAKNGILFSEIYRELTLGVHRLSLAQIPQVIFVLETCESGILNGTSQIINLPGGGQTFFELSDFKTIDQIGIITATSGAKESYKLNGTRFSTFGLFFARALGDTEDWACADKDSADGIMTLNELVYHLKKRLREAYEKHWIPGEMVPQLLGSEKLFVAYRPNRHHDDGARDQIAELLATPPKGVTAEVSFDDGSRYICTDGCAPIPISRSYKGKVTVDKDSLNMDSLLLAELNRLNEKGAAKGSGQPPPPLRSSVDAQDLFQQKNTTVVGVNLQIR